MSTTEVGHEPNRMYVDQDGNIHLNGSSIFLDESGTALSPTEASYFDGVTAGAVTASKGLLVDANKDLAALRNVTVTNLDAGAPGTAGTLDVFPTTASKGKLAISVTDQTGDTTVSLVAGAMATARTITIRDPGAAASFLTTSDATAALTDATAVEIGRVCDRSARTVAATGTLSVTEALHDGKTILLDTASGSVCTLPAPVIGMRVRFIVSVKPTSNFHQIKVASSSDFLAGSANILDVDANAQTAYPAITASDDNIQLNGTTKGGQIGDWVEVEGITATHWAIKAQLTVPAGSDVADMFSAAV